MTESIPLFLGYCVLVLGGAAVVFAALIAVSALANRATWHVVEACGGIKTLREFGVWHRNNKKGGAE